MKANVIGKFLRQLTGVFCSLVVCCLALSACSREKACERDASSVRNGGYPMRFTDDGGRSVLIPRLPERIVSLAPSVSDIVATLGDGNRLVGVSKWCDTASLSGVERLGGMDAPDMERIVSMRPDLVMGTEMTPVHIYEKLAAAGIPCVMFKHAGLNDLMDDMRTISSILGCGADGQAVVDSLAARMAKLQEGIPQGEAPVKVALLYGLDYLGSAGKGSWVDDMLTRIGLDNIANRAQSPWPRLSKESLITEQPRFILLQLPADEAGARAVRAQVEAMKTDVVWSRVDAVREGRVVLLPANLLNIPGPRTVDAMEFIAAAVRGR